MQLKNATKKLLSLIAAAAIVMSFASVLLAADDGTETYDSLFVSAEWLKANRENVLIFDTRDDEWYRDPTGKNIREHITGAVNVETEAFANLGTPGSDSYYTVKNAAEIAKLLGKHGYDGSKQVVLYGDGGMSIANPGWGVWILRMCGYKNARILDGGWTAWKAVGGPSTDKPFSHKAITHPGVKFDTSYVVTTEWMKEHVSDPSIKIVDVRMEREYTGQMRPFGEKRPGHIPGAINLPMDSLLNDDFTAKKEGELEALLAAQFPDKAQEIIIYDTIGVRGAFVTMLFRMAGYPNARNYDAGYGVWCAAADTEIRQGPNP